MSISRRKIASTEDFLKQLSDQIQELKNKGTQNTTVLSYIRLLPESFSFSDTITTNFGLNTLSETITCTSDLIRATTQGFGSFQIDVARIGYSQIV